MSLGERIYQLRTAHGLSQENLAEIVGVSRQAISKWETDQSVPEIDKVLLLSEKFSVSTDELLGKTEMGILPSQQGNEPCAYCGKRQAHIIEEDNGEYAFCNKVCQKSYSTAMKNMKKNSKWFYAGLAVSVVIMLAGAFSSIFIGETYLPYIVGGSIMMMGTVIILFPFCTPQTIKKLGIRKSETLARISGMGLELLGIFFMFFLR